MLVVGVIERGGGTLYCCVLFFDADGNCLGKHRKLMPTGAERLIWGFGDGSTLPVFDSPLGRIGAVICWENYMPLLRMAMYAKGIQIYCAPTADPRDSWLASMRHIAIEGRCFVLACNQYLLRHQVAPDAPNALGDAADSVLQWGGSCIVNPFGEVLAGPDYDGEAVIVAEIDIAAIGAKKAELPALAFSYTPTAAEVVNNGHTIQVNLAEGGTLTLDGVPYKLLQFHFHTPSEERINGKSYPLVAHLVHKSAEGKLAVVGVMIKEGKINTALKEVFDNLSNAEGEKKALNGDLKIADMLPSGGYYKYTGSLTTPPCSEGVRWQVMKQPIEASKDQIKAFQKLYKMNARPVQPLNGRKLEQS
ncbi:hypothetical protein AYR66_01650 [Noviherbaspirillum denitrificans]|uniref:Alpha-carbonic anhydrase domain-containing protein n=2 Tax=Noviherbaspirillum denitrificans TaxID=1968433 RepID=A0A254T6N0_9BURK|nr:hypothetical protein AYR66_01650 [Noviherbaspirillum denitrificans]